MVTAGNWSEADGVIQAAGSNRSYLGNDFDLSLQPSQEDGITLSSMTGQQSSASSSMARRPSSARVEQAFHYLDNI